MDVNNLVKMANAIGTFYLSVADREAGSAAVANHISRSWDPRMRAALMSHASADGRTELLPIVIDAIRRLSPVSENTPARSAV